MFKSLFGKPTAVSLSSAMKGSTARLTPGSELMALRMTMLGRENAGKSALLTAFDLVWMNLILKSGLQLNLLGADGVTLSPLILATRMEKIQRRLWAMSEEGDGLKSTLATEPVNYCVCEGATPRLQLLTSEEIGQVISHTKSDSPEADLQRYHDFLGRLSRAELITIVFSPPAPEANAMAAFQWAKDQKLYSSYLIEALRMGDPRKPVSVAVVINKLDTLFGDESSAREAWNDQMLLDEFEGLVQTVRHERRVTHAALFPVSVYGFGNAFVREPSSGTPELIGDVNADGPQIWSLTTRGGLEKEYGLRGGRAIEPFNLNALVLWSLLAAALPQEIEINVNGNGETEVALARVCRLLSEDLARQPGWMVDLKGGTA